MIPRSIIDKLRLSTIGYMTKYVTSGLSIILRVVAYLAAILAI